MEWCCSLDRRTSEGGEMKRPDRGAKSCVGGVASSSSPRGRKDRGQGRSSRDRTRAIHIRRSWCVHRASHEREAPDSFPFATDCPFLQIRSSFHTPQSHIPPDPRLSVFPSAADKTSSRFLLPEFSLERPPIRSHCQFKFVSSHHPIPIFSFYTARYKPSLSRFFLSN